MSKLRRYLDAAGEGAVTRLARKVGVEHSHISRIADGHRLASLPLALAIQAATGGAVTPGDLAPKPNTRKGKKAASRTRERA